MTSRMGDRDSDSEPVLQNQDELTTTVPPTTDPPTGPVTSEESVIQRQQPAVVLPFTMVEDDQPSRQSQYSGEVRIASGSQATSDSLARLSNYSQTLLTALPSESSHAYPYFLHTGARNIASSRTLPTQMHLDVQPGLRQDTDGGGSISQQILNPNLAPPSLSSPNIASTSFPPPSITSSQSLLLPQTTPHIHRLPAELLGSIFSFTSAHPCSVERYLRGEDPHSISLRLNIRARTALSLSHVCRKWRHAALLHTGLWARIDGPRYGPVPSPDLLAEGSGVDMSGYGFRFGYGLGVGPGSGGGGGGGGGSPQGLMSTNDWPRGWEPEKDEWGLVNLCLERSKNAPLYISDIHCSMPRTIFLHSNRLKSLCTSRRIYRGNLLDGLSMPILESLVCDASSETGESERMGTGVRAEGTIFPSVAFRSRFPKLRRLFFKAISSWPGHHFERLTHLALSGCERPEVGLGEFLDLLRRCPGLEVLVLSEWFPKADPEPDDRVAGGEGGGGGGNGGRGGGGGGGGGGERRGYEPVVLDRLKHLTLEQPTIQAFHTFLAQLRLPASTAVRLEQSPPSARRFLPAPIPPGPSNAPSTHNIGGVTYPASVSHFSPSTIFSRILLLSRSRPYLLPRSPHDSESELRGAKNVEISKRDVQLFVLDRDGKGGIACFSDPPGSGGGGGGGGGGGEAGGGGGGQGGQGGREVLKYSRQREWNLPSGAFEHSAPHSASTFSSSTGTSSSSGSASSSFDIDDVHALNEGDPEPNIYNPPHMVTPLDFTHLTSLALILPHPLLLLTDQNHIESYVLQSCSTNGLLQAPSLRELTVCERALRYDVWERLGEGYPRSLEVLKVVGPFERIRRHSDSDSDDSMNSDRSGGSGRRKMGTIELLAGVLARRERAGGVTRTGIGTGIGIGGMEQSGRIAMVKLFVVDPVIVEEHAEAMERIRGLVGTLEVHCVNIDGDGGGDIGADVSGSMSRTEVLRSEREKVEDALWSTVPELLAEGWGTAWGRVP